MKTKTQMSWVKNELSKFPQRPLLSIIMSASSFSFNNLMRKMKPFFRSHTYNLEQMDKQEDSGDEE